MRRVIRSQFTHFRGEPVAAGYDKSVAKEHLRLSLNKFICNGTLVKIPSVMPPIDFFEYFKRFESALLLDRADIIIVSTPTRRIVIDTVIIVFILLRALVLRPPDGEHIRHISDFRTDKRMCMRVCLVLSAQVIYLFAQFKKFARRIRYFQTEFIEEGNVINKPAHR